MHIELTTLMVVSALVSALVLVLNRGDKIVPVIAVIAAGLEAAMHFDLFSLSSGRFRIDVILPALLVVTGGICWARAGAKGAVTAATVLFAVGLIQLGASLRFLT